MLVRFMVNSGKKALLGLKVESWHYQWSIKWVPTRKKKKVPILGTDNKPLLVSFGLYQDYGNPTCWNLNALRIGKKIG